MLNKIREWINKNRLINCEDTVLAACSGGPDSLALVHILYQLRLEYNIKLFVAHVDHMFRGEESAADARFVANFCREYGLVCYHTQIDVPSVVRCSGRSAQDAARMVRYEYLRQVAAELGGARIATGHHADDQAETVLINLLRGSGSVGLRGMKAVSGDIIRPLLSVNRFEIENYCDCQQLKPRIDKSNLKTDYLRNRVRLKLLPLLEDEYNSSIKQTLCRTAAIISDEHDYISVTAKDLWKQAAEVKGEVIHIDIALLQAAHIAVQREVVRLAIEKKQGHLKGITFYHVEKVLEAACRGRIGSVLELPSGLTVTRNYTALELTILDCNAPSSSNSLIEIPGVKITIPGTTQIAELSIKVTAKITAMPPAIKSKDIAVFDWQAIKTPVYIRTRQPGDKFRALGMAGHRKLKDFFIDAKIPRILRDSIPIFSDSEEIIWVGGYRQTERGKITSQTRQFLQLTISKVDEFLEDADD